MESEFHSLACHWGRTAEWVKHRTEPYDDSVWHPAMDIVQGKVMKITPTRPVEFAEQKQEGGNITVFWEV